MSRPTVKDFRWHKFQLRLALAQTIMSKDPATKVGSVIVDPGNRVLATGFNGLPRGIKDTSARLEDRDMKLRLVVHAELNAVLSAAHNGVALAGSTLYLAATDDTGQIWGGAPCLRCTTHIIQAGIVRVVTPPPKVPSKWAEEISWARDLLAEARIQYIEVPDAFSGPI